MKNRPLTLRPFEDHAALAICRDLDVWDYREATAVRGAGATHLALFGDWRAMQPHLVLSLMLYWGETPFALLALANTGQGGVATAGLLARNHSYYRLALATAARTLRDGLPEWAAETGVHRIEARAWVRHPRASGFLRAVGFRHECDMPGFGPGGAETFRQFAWTPAPAPTQTGD